MSYTVTRFAKGTIWWCNLSEDNMLSYMQKGRRPCLIISSSETNEIEHACTILPISTAEKYEEYINTHQVVKFNYSSMTSYILCNMPRRVSTFKLDKYYGTLSDELLDKVMSNYLYYLDYDNKVDNSTDLSSAIYEVLKFISATKPNNANNTVEDINVEKSVKDHKEVKENAKADDVDIITNSKELCAIKAQGIKPTNFNTSNIKTATSNKKSNAVNSDRLATLTNNNITPNTNSTVHRGADKCKRRKTIFEQGYWQIKENNIEFWNELLIGDFDSMIKKYKYKSRTDVSRRKYNVKRFLLDNGYTIEDLKTFIEK